MILGITGKIASGKTEIMKLLNKKGFYCIYADKIVNDLYKKGKKGAQMIVKFFGEEFLNKDGSVNKNKLRDAVFNDSKKLLLLNKIIHPLVYAEILKLLKKHKKENIAIEAVYFDNNLLNSLVDKVLWVYRNKKDILNFLITVKGFKYKMALKVFNLIRKSPQIDFIIRNKRNLSDLVKLVDEIEI